MSGKKNTEAEPILPVSFLIGGKRYEVYRLPKDGQDMQLEGPDGYFLHGPDDLLAMILAGRYKVINRRESEAKFN
jgi:hypothetical protein